jgi:WD40 repeat protein
MGVAWWPERKSLLTAEGFPGSFMEGVIVPVQGGERRYLPLDGTSVMYPTYNLAAKRLVFQRKWLDINLLRGSLKNPLEPLRPVVASSHLDIGVDVSPDGQQIVFVSSRTGRIAIWRADRDGSNQIQLASSADESLGSPRWMPDGKNIILDGGRAGVSSLYVVSSEGGIPSRVPGKGQFVKPFVSPDGKWIYYTNSATGRREVYRMPFGGGEQKQLTQEGGTDAMTSKDGSIVFYIRDGDIRKIPAQGGPETTITDGAKRGRWTLAGDMIYVIRDRGGRAVIAEVSPNGGKERIILESALTPEGQTTASGLAVSPLTGEVFIQRQARTESDLMIVERFR